MTTISPNRRRRAQNSRKRIFLVLGGLVFLFIFASLLRSPLERTLWFLAGPLAEVRTAAAAVTGVFFDGFNSHASLAQENAALRAELEEARIQLLDRDLFYKENFALKAQFGRSASNTPGILASVIARPPGVPYDTLMLDVGEREGVREGDRVAAGGSVYIGTVTETHSGSSRVVLFSAPGEKHRALLLTGSASTTLATLPISVVGQGGGSMKAEVPAGVLVNMGDEVVFENLMPEMFAQVTHVEKKRDSSFQTVYLQLPVNIFSLRFVEVRSQAAYVE